MSSYDRETKQLPAFQSGVGNKKDLQVHMTKSDSYREVFHYTLQIEGIEKSTISVYPKRYFQYRFKASVNDQVEYSHWYEGNVDGKHPLLEELSGKEDFTTIIDIDHSLVGEVLYEIELVDETGMINYLFDNGSLQTNDLSDYVTFFSTLGSTEKKTVQKVWRGVKISSTSQHTIYHNETFRVEEMIPAPHYDPKLEGWNITEWSVRIHSDNPNVSIWVSREPDYKSTAQQFLPIELKAQIINAQQTPWIPSIHHGFYYLNQAEHYLFSETKALGAIKQTKEYPSLKFTYTIDLNATRTKYGQFQEWQDIDYNDFNGVFEKTTLDRYIGDIALIEGETYGTYISDVKTFDHQPKEYHAIQWDQTTPDGSSIQIYTSSQQEDGSWTVWKEEINQEVIKSPLSKNIRYKVDLHAGSKASLTTIKKEDDSSEDFSQGISNNITIHSNYIEMNDLSLTTSRFESRTFDFGFNIQSYDQVAFSYEIPPSLSGDVIVSVATQSEDINWELATWSPVEEITQINTTTYTASIPSPVQRYLRYRVELSRGRSQVERTFYMNTGLFSEGQSQNIIVNNQAYTLSDVTQSGYFISSVGYFERNELWLDAIITSDIPTNGSVVLKTISSDDPMTLEGVLPTDSRWSDSSAGFVTSPTADYLIAMIELSPGQDESGKPASPTVSEVVIAAESYDYVTPKLYRVSLTGQEMLTTVVTPQLHWINVSGTTEDVLTSENYSTSLTSDVLLDGQPHVVSQYTIEDLVDRALNEQQVDLMGLTKDQYSLRTQETGLMLSSRSLEDSRIIYEADRTHLGYVYAQSTETPSEVVVDRLDIYVDEKNEVLLSPVPQQGSPIIIIDASGKELRQVHFYNDKGRPSLEFKEELIIEESHQLLLSYIDIDTTSLTLTSSDQEEVLPITNYTIEENRITLLDTYPVGTKILARYKLQHSFAVDYNYEPSKDVAKIYLHQPILTADRSVEIYYETNRQSPYYIAEEINLNPLYHLQQSGFIYISQQLEPCARLELHINPLQFVDTGQDMTYFIAISKDRHGNPVSGEEISFSSSDGTIEVIQPITNYNGMAIAKYIAPSYPCRPVIEALCTKTGIKKSQILDVVSYQQAGHLYVSPSRSYVDQLNSEVEVTIELLNKHQEPVAQSSIHLEATSGSFQSSVVQTNHKGIAKAIYRTDFLTNESFVQLTITSPLLTIKEEINLRIYGVSENV